MKFLHPRAQRFAAIPVGQKVNSIEFGSGNKTTVSKKTIFNKYCIHSKKKRFNTFYIYILY